MSPTLSIFTKLLTLNLKHNIEIYRFDECNAVVSFMISLVNHTTISLKQINSTICTK